MNKNHRFYTKPTQPNARINSTARVFETVSKRTQSRVWYSTPPWCCAQSKRREIGHYNTTLHPSLFVRLARTWHTAYHSSAVPVQAHPARDQYDELCTDWLSAAAGMGQTASQQRAPVSDILQRWLLSAMPLSVNCGWTAEQLRGVCSSILWLRLDTCTSYMYMYIHCIHHAFTRVHVHM